MLYIPIDCSLLSAFHQPVKNVFSWQSCFCSFQLTVNTGGCGTDRTETHLVKMLSSEIRFSSSKICCIPAEWGHTKSLLGSLNSLVEWVGRLECSLSFISRTHSCRVTIRTFSFAWRDSFLNLVGECQLGLKIFIRETYFKPGFPLFLFKNYNWK